MKKAIYIFASLAVTLAFSGAPALAISTGFQKSEGGGAAPEIKVKWEMNRSSGNTANANFEDGLDDSTNPGAQFEPSGQYEVGKPIWVCAIATDPDGLSDIDEDGAVYADIFYPDDYGFHNPTDDPADYGVNGCGQQFNYELQLLKLSKVDGLELFCDKIRNDNNDLPTWDEAYNYEEICAQDGELQKETAAVYCKYTELDYEDPAGDYTVQVHAVDKAGVTSDPDLLINDFEYLEKTAFAVDFTSVVYGSVKLNTHKIINGDLTWAPSSSDKPTVRNVGNTRLNMTVWQDDMGLGQHQNGGSPEWNVEWDARVGSNAEFTVYDPFEVGVVLDETLNLSETDEMDFSILVKKFPLGTGVNGNYTGSMTLGAEREDFRQCDSAQTGHTDAPTHQPPFGNEYRYPGAFIRGA